MGLTLAHRLSCAGHSVVVLEAAPQLGGLATWFDFGEFTWDKFYHVILRSDSAMLDLIDELGLSEQMRWAETLSGFLWRGRHLSMSNNWEFLTFPVLNLWEKFRLGLGILYCQRIKDPTHLETITAAEWMTRIFGKRVYLAIWEPLLQSKYGVLADSLPATIMWSTITRYYSTRSKSDGVETMGYMSGSLETFFDGLAQSIRSHGGEIRCEQRVDAIDVEGSGPVRVESNGRTFDFDRVVSTLPSALLKRVAPGLAAQLHSHQHTPRMLGVIRVALVLRRPLSPYYVTNLIQKGFPFTGIIEVSGLVDRTELADRHFVMLPRYDVPDSPYFERNEDEIATEFIDALKPVWPDIRDNLLKTFVHREKRVQALWIDAPPADPRARRTDDDRVWSVNAELAGRDTLNNNAIITVADRAAAEFVASAEPPR